MPAAGYGEIVSDGANGNAIARSVTRSLTASVNGPAHRCEFRTTVSMPTFSVGGGDWYAFTGRVFHFHDIVHNFSSADFVDSGPVEGFRFGLSYSGDGEARSEYGLALQTVGGVHAWVLERCALNLYEPQISPPYIHTAWAAPWRTAFTTWNAARATLTFVPMAESEFLTLWRSAAYRGASRTGRATETGLRTRMHGLETERTTTCGWAPPSR